VKIIIAGSRDITDYSVIENGMKKVSEKYLNGVLPHGLTILSGCARGVDTLAIQWAETHNANVHKYPANWNHFGKSAGYRRNDQMAKHGDMLVAFWDKKSKGTKHMIECAQQKKIPVHIFEIPA
jgi:hypothetical protein